MAAFGQLKPPDPGGPQKEPASGSPNGCWPPIEAATRSFAAVAKAPTLSRFPKITLASRQYGVKDGKPAISFSAAELKAGEDNLRFTLVAKFSQGRPHIEDIRKAFLSAWNLNYKCSIGAWDARHILIVLDNEGEVCKVLAHPLRKIGHSLFRVFRWSKDFNLKKEPSTTSTWIRLPSLPPQMYNPGYIEPIVTSFGRFIAVDNRTTSFINPSFARACVEIDTTSKLPDKVWISTGMDEGFWQGIEYENNLLFCSKCKLHGHDLANCRKLKRKMEADQCIWAARDEFGLPTGAPASTVTKAPSALAAPPAPSALTAPAATPGNAKVIGVNMPKSNQEGQQKKEWTLVQNRKKNNKSMQKQKKADYLSSSFEDKPQDNKTLEDGSERTDLDKATKILEVRPGKANVCTDQDKATVALAPTSLPPKPKATPTLNNCSDLTSTLAEESQMEETEKTTKDELGQKAITPSPQSTPSKPQKHHLVPSLRCGELSLSECIADPITEPFSAENNTRPATTQVNSDSNLTTKSDTGDIRTFEVSTSHKEVEPIPLVTYVLRRTRDMEKARDKPSSSSIPRTSYTPFYPSNSPQKALPPLDMYSRKHGDDDPHYFRRANPYID